jgi:hypothetical protein
MLATIILLAWGCADAPVIAGKVQDIWGKPLEGAEVRMQGEDSPARTGVDGKFSFPAKAGELSFRADAGGHIYEVEKLVYDPEAEDRPPLVIQLYPAPEENGFFAVGKEDYMPLKGRKAKRVATPLQAFHGLADVGETKLGETPKILFHTSLRKEQIRQIDLKLNRLEFKEHAEVTGLMGAENVEIDLWLASDRADFKLKGMNEEHMFMISFEERPTKGVYAFHSGNMLTSSDPDALPSQPEELQVAYPFELN